MSRHHRDLPLVILFDATARIGTYPTAGIGKHSADTEHNNGVALRELTSTFDLCIPATFFDLLLVTNVCQSASLQHCSAPWFWSNFVVVPGGWTERPLCTCQGETDLATADRVDHVPAFVTVACLMVARGTTCGPKRVDMLRPLCTL